MIKSEQNFKSEILESEIADAYNAIVEEAEGGDVGYYFLPEDGEIVTKIESFCLERDLGSIQNVVVIGIGGSSLGTKAIDRLLSLTSKRDESKTRRRNDKNLIFMENVDPNEIEENLKDVTLQNSIFIIISKSGGTIETTSSLKYLVDRFELSFEDEAFRDHFVVITDPSSPLDQFAVDFGLSVFHLPTNVGGRFSVFTPVGLLPLCMLGYDIGELLGGAEDLKKSFFSRKEDDMVKKAHFYAKNSTQHPINVLFSYSSAFKYFNEWFVQLWGESLGKISRDGENVGLTPIGIVGSVDQHSFLQLIIEGPRDKTVTMIKVDDFENNLTIPDITIPHLEKTNFINTKSFNTLINAQCDATMQSITDQNVPLDLITIDRLTERSVGYMIFYHELLTSLAGYFLNVNTYNQPGVELGKVILKEKFEN